MTTVLVLFIGIGIYVLYKVLPYRRSLRIGIAASVGLLALGAVGHMIEDNPQKKTAPEPQQQGPKVVSEITWSEVRNKFIEKVKVSSDLTSAQEEKMKTDIPKWWNESYRGKWVQWKGSVKNVRSGGSSIDIKMDEGFWWEADITIVSPFLYCPAVKG